MGYKIVAVSPLNKPFPIAYFGLANITSLDDAKLQIGKWFKDAKEVGIESESVRRRISGMTFSQGEVSKIETFWDQGRDERIAMLEVRWGKIQPALEAHLARQKRRQVHFESACRLEGCDNPRRGKRSGAMQAAKSRRPGVHPLFCGAHMWLRRALTRFALNALHAKSANRVRLV